MSACVLTSPPSGWQGMHAPRVHNGLPERTILNIQRLPQPFRL